MLLNLPQSSVVEEWVVGHDHARPTREAGLVQYTLCPLGEPETAIGHEPRIEACALR